MDSVLKGWTVASLSLSVLFLSVLVLGLGTKQLDLGKVVAPERSSSSKSPAVVKGTAKLSLVSSEAAFSVSQKANIGISVDSGKEDVSAFDVKLVFDPLYLQVVDIKPSSFLKNPTILSQQIDNKAGVASLAFGAFSPAAGSGEAAQVIVLPKKEGESKISFSADSKVAATGGASILGSTSAISLNISK